MLCVLDLYDVFVYVLHIFLNDPCNHLHTHIETHTYTAVRIVLIHEQIFQDTKQKMNDNTTISFYKKRIFCQHQTHAYNCGRMRSYAHSRYGLFLCFLLIHNDWVFFICFSFYIHIDPKTKNKQPFSISMLVQNIFDTL